jgi:pyruvate dehydrogenase E2 component (dihydrolipoamide acetyltransferase)
VIGDARDGRIGGDHSGPAALTISNLGMFGVDWFQAIVDPDQAAILAAGTIARRVVPTENGLAVVPQVELVLSVDHRVADGAAAAQFLQTLRAELE